MDFPRVHFYPLCCNETTSLKNDTFIWIRKHILYFVYATSLSDLCFNKKFEQGKKSLYNSNWMRCLVTLNKIFFLTSQKGGGNWCLYWKTIIPDRNQIHAAPNFLLLSSYIGSLRRINLLHITTPGYKGWRKE